MNFEDRISGSMIRKLEIVIGVEENEGQPIHPFKGVRVEIVDHIQLRKRSVQFSKSDSV